MSDRPTAVIVDDSEMFLMYFAVFLNRLNIDVLPVRSGEEAYNLSRVVKPDLITLDLALSEEDGVDILKQIRQDRDIADTPVIIVSGKSERFEECNTAGATACVNKPININSINDALEKCRLHSGGRRRFLRAPLNKNVRFSIFGRYAECQAINLSEGGIYLRTIEPLHPGMFVLVELPCSDGEILELPGEIIYTKGIDKGRFMIPPGMAIRFDDYDDDISVRLKHEVADLLVGDILTEQPEEVMKPE